MKKLKIGFALSGSFCTLDSSIKQMEILKNLGHDILPIMSFNVYNLDTKFGKAKDFIQRVENICDKKILNTLPEVEPIGPKKLTDIMVVCPCTGNTLGKICRGSTNTPVTLGVKSHLRTKRPVVIAFASNDALGISAQNLGVALNLNHLYFVPLSQDDYINKPTSLVAHFDLLHETILNALENKQIQPIFK